MDCKSRPKWISINDKKWMKKIKRSVTDTLLLPNSVEDFDKGIPVVTLFSLR